MKEEFFDIVDENNLITGKKKLRSEAHTQGLWHRVVQIYFFRKFNNEIQILVHLRAKNKDQNPNKWDTRFGGHSKAGENVQNTIKNEMLEEIGLELKTSNLIDGGTYKRDNYPNREFIYRFYYKFEEENISNLRFNDGEVQEIKWMKVAEILESIENNPNLWSANKVGFNQALEELEDKLSN